MKTRRFIPVLVFLLLIGSALYFIPSAIRGYSYTEQGAIRSLPYQDGVVIQKKQFGNRTMMVWETEKDICHIMIVSKSLGLFHRVTQMAPIQARDPQDMIIPTWSAQLTKNKTYDTILAAAVMDQRIKKVIVTNEGSFRKLSSLEEAKELSTVYVEIDVAEGYALHYMELQPADTGNFVFWGSDEQGTILAKSS